MTKEDFLLWKSDPVTEAFMESIKKRRLELSSIVTPLAGENQLKDRFMAGMYHAFGEVLDTEYEDSQ